MFKSLVIFITAAILWAFGLGISLAEADKASGEDLFRSMQCAGCHRVEGKGVGMDLKQIAKGYADKAGRLDDYLAGKAEALLNPAKARIMVNQIKKTKVLSPAQRQALAGYLLSFK